MYIFAMNANDTTKSNDIFHVRLTDRMEIDLQKSLSELHLNAGSSICNNMYIR